MINKKDLLYYEVPSIGEYVSNEWLAEIISRYLAWKINRKWKRYQKRLERINFISNFTKVNKK